MKETPLNPEAVRRGSAVRDFRKLRDVTPDELANKVGVSRPHLSNIEAGRKMLLPELAVKIATHLDVSPTSLLRPDELLELAS